VTLFCHKQPKQTPTIVFPCIYPLYICFNTEGFTVHSVSSCYLFFLCIKLIFPPCIEVFLHWYMLYCWESHHVSVACVRDVAIWAAINVIKVVYRNLSISYVFMHLLK